LDAGLDRISLGPGTTTEIATAWIPDKRSLVNADTITNPVFQFLSWIDILPLTSNTIINATLAIHGRSIPIWFIWISPITPFRGTTALSGIYRSIHSYDCRKDKSEKADK